MKTSDDLRSALRTSIVNTLQTRGGDSALNLPEASAGSPAVILIVGVNGGGKTTTIGKLSHKFASEGAKVMLGSGDTFRAAAFEQLKTWGERTGAAMGSYTEGSRPAKVRLCVAFAPADVAWIDSPAASMCTSMLSAQYTTCTVVQTWRDNVLESVDLQGPLCTAQMM